MIAAPVPAQDDADDSDAGGPLVRLLENTLSNDSRTIEVVGLEGALSAQATIERIVVSDDQGPWFTLEDAVLDWNRLSLVRGRFSVNELSAQRIEILRTPDPAAEPKTELPSPQVQPFQIPELPVVIEIAQFSITEIDIAEPVIGTAARLGVNGRLNLADGGLDTLLSVNRLDHQGDALTLQAGFANETRNIDLNVTLTEAAGGLLATALKMPGSPAVAFTARGNGPVNDFTADIGLATDGIRRFGGTVALAGEPAKAGGDAQAIGFTADLNGDLTALMDPAFHPFFGTVTALNVDGDRQPDGRLTVDSLSVASQALDLDGALALTAAGAPERVTLTGRLTAHNGSDRIVLPVSGADTTIRSADIDLQLDATQSDAWTLALEVDGFENPAAAIDTLSLTGDGQITLGDTTQMSGAVRAAIDGLALPDATLSETVGDVIELTGRFDLPGDGTLGLDDIQLTGAGIDATAGADISGLGTGFQLDGQAAVEIADLARFAALTGHDLSGTLSADLTGNGAPLGGSFDLVLNGTAQDVTVGIAEADALLAGTTMLNVDAERGPDGIALRAFDLANDQLSASGTGALQSGSASLDFEAALIDMGLVVPEIPGPATLTADVTNRDETWSGAVRFDGPDEIFADINGDVTTTGGADVDLTAEFPGVERFVPQLVGTLTVSGTVDRDARSGEGSAVLEIRGPSDLAADLDARLNGDGDADLTLAAALSTLEAFIPQLVGAATVMGDVQGNINDQTASGQIRIEALKAITADISGNFDTNGPTDVDIRADMARLETFVPQLPGPARVTVDLTRTRATADWEAQAHVNAPSGIIAAIDAALTPNGDADINLSTEIPQLGLFVPQLVGRATLDAQANRTGATQDWTTQVALDGPEDISATVNGTANEAGSLDMRFLVDLPRLEVLVSQLVGAAQASGQVSRSVDGEWIARTNVSAPADITARANAAMAEAGPLTAQVDANIPNLGLFVPQLPGPASLGADIDRTANGTDYSGTVRLTGPDAIFANADGHFSTTGPANLALAAEFPRLERFVPQLPGTARLNATVNRSDAAAPWLVSTRASAPQDITLAADISAEPDGTVSLTYDAAMARLEAFVAQIPGAITVTGSANRDAGGSDWAGQTRVAGPDGIFADVQGTLTEGGDADLTLSAGLARFERFVPDFPGSVAVNGTAQRANAIWTIAADTDLPSGANMSASGTYNETAGTADIQATGSAQLAATNGIIAPNSIQGPLNFDLRLNGVPGLDTLSGTISTSGVEVAIPQIQNAINGFGGSATLGNGQANLDFNGNIRTGGGFSISGPVTLNAPFDGNISFTLLDLILTDNVLYETVLSGGVTISGPLTGAALVSGQIDVGETEINIATSGGTGPSTIPDMEHLGETQAQFLTRQRAGLVKKDAPEDTGPPPPPIRLDIIISAPNRIFVRGRGLDAELGGQLYIGGTAANVQPTGAIELIRGHLDLLTQRLEFTRGVVTLQGNLEPVIDFEATTTASEGSATLSIDGPALAPNINVTSDPERPSEEALAMLIFGDQFSNLSPIKIAQIAAALNQLRGGGSGLTDSVREGASLAALDLSTDEEGNAAVGVGAYLSDNVYTDVTINARGETEVNINLDITNSITAKGSVDSQSNTSLGIFFERDY